ncbi:MAG: 1-acyl-sn-glycerol-3-phosphate acyltransferase [Fischerella sp.]|nr:1-acyl-sn-glycerol-3-phosphate acyltransferase [Fischerella sp.]
MFDQPSVDIDIIEYDHNDSLVVILRNHSYKNDYVYLKPKFDKLKSFTINYLDPDFKPIIILDHNASHILVPYSALRCIHRSILDYPYINYCNESFYPDIIFLSNGEPLADRLFNILKKRVGNYPNIIHRISNINDRSKALKKCAELSQTKWFLCINAKLEVVENFNWAWKPDNFFEEKHYIFHAKNPLNGLTYGHMGLVAFNKHLVLKTDNHGLDFTMSQPHCEVPVLSGIARYNQNPLMTWRTAFRETVKLKYFSKNINDKNADERLKIWCTVAEGDYAEWSLRGALDGVAFYNEVKGDINELMNSFYWSWLQERFEKLYGT